MKTKNVALKIVCVFLFFTCSAIAESDVFTIKDLKGRSMQIVLVSKKGEKFEIRRIKDNAKFTIAASSLDEASQKVLLEKAEDLAASYPELKLDVVIGKRRKSENDSYYMKSMEVTAKVTLTNTERDTVSPPCDCAIVFFGQDQRNDDIFEVLSNQKFELTPNKEGAIFDSKPFVSTYDSDNKGTGNIGGSKYVGYLLIVRDGEKNVLATKTVYSKIKDALSDATFPNRMYSTAAKTKLSDEMKKL